jgi:hypothetical protein
MSRATITSPRALLLLLLAAGALLLAVLHSSGSHGPATATAADGAQSPAAARAAAGRAAARAEVALLRRPRSATRDAIPPALLGGPMLADGAIDTATARTVLDDGEATYVASSSDGRDVCAIADGAMGCTPTAALAAAGTTPSIAGRRGEPFHVFGVAADDVSDLVLVEADGTETPVTATDGVYRVDTGAWPQALTWSTPEGPQRFAFPARD